MVFKLKINKIVLKGKIVMSVWLEKIIYPQAHN